MLVIEDLQVVGARHKETPGLFERYSVLALIRDVLCTVPLDSHLEPKLLRGGTKSMA